MIWKEGDKIYSNWHFIEKSKEKGSATKKLGRESESAMSTVKDEKADNIKDYIYLIAEGIVRLEAINNPYLRKDLDK